MTKKSFNPSRLILILGLSSVCLLSACSAEQHEASVSTDVGSTDVGSAENKANNTADKPAGVIPAHQLDALERAKSVEGVLQEAEARRAKAQ